MLLAAVKLWETLLITPKEPSTGPYFWRWSGHPGGADLLSGMKGFGGWVGGGARGHVQHAECGFPDPLTWGPGWEKNVLLMTVDGWGNDRWLLPLLIVMMVSPRNTVYLYPRLPPLLLCGFLARLPVSSTHFCHSLHFLQSRPRSPSPTLHPTPNFTSIAAFCRLHLNKHDVVTFSKNKWKTNHNRSFCRPDRFQPFHIIIQPIVTTNYLFYCEFEQQVDVYFGFQLLEL